ncbi:CoA pyrophosphatase [Stakelama tenebrarum]|uniref:CoA pyrophosphatase n=1 Tax=Stakelama tenebrarum TaxID=2711215 RepID=A0A6G6Y4Q3_9SPHN|nr:CoA pyrophosphatase [Sphingosinithalassobacter tenebrarum]QIG79895.1 CoA pyrophosphatase [Sphingosinithalassobacter tenebrarum]
MNLAQRLRVALAAANREQPVLLTGDYRDDDPAIASYPAAVLVAMSDADDPHVILTQRPDTMRHHAGQIAFPGGKIDRDEDAVAAALREAEEEISLPRDRVDIIGTADRYRTVTGFEVTPVLGVVPPDIRLIPHQHEVADVFQVPLAFLMDETNHVQGSLEWQGRKRHYYEIHWDNRRIWGATAAMIVNLSRRLKWTL